MRAPPSEEDIDRWVMMEDNSPHPREAWLLHLAEREMPDLCLYGVERIVDIDAGTVVFRKPRYIEVWLPDTHLTGRMGRELDGYDTLAVVEITDRGETTVR